MIKRIMIFVLLTGLPIVSSAQNNGYKNRPCCTYEDGTWYVGGRDRTWWENKYPGSWQKFGLDTRSPLDQPVLPILQNNQQFQALNDQYIPHLNKEKCNYLLIKIKKEKTDEIT